ncbi:tRNA dihydrouridine synthase DusB [bacterium]|nr:tRNA dihydrouridine synthase DusB [bacterium]
MQPAARNGELVPAPAICLEPFEIGSVPIPSRFFFAPMAGYSSLALRLALRELGGMGLATTELVNARSLIEKRQKAFELAETSAEEQPVAIQIYGHVAWEMIDAAKMCVDLGASIIDINMGCPVKKIVKSGGGSALLCDVDNAGSLVEAVVQAVSVPVTVKMRLGWDDATPTAPELTRRFESIGVAAVIIHGRTREQSFMGTVNLPGIASVVAAAEKIPIVGNGDVRTLFDAERMFRETGCSAVSIGRGALGNPFLFRELDLWAKTGDPGPAPGFSERVDLMDRHFHYLVKLRGERTACTQFRKTLAWYQHAIRAPKALYHQLINLPSVARFDETIAEMRKSGPTGPLPSHFEPKIPTPKGPIDKW